MEPDARSRARCDAARVAPAEPQPSAAATTLAIVVSGGLLLLPGLGRMGAMDSTDARYLAIAREMARSGDWLVPRLGGVPHLDKPPLAYWASALGERLFGASELGGRAVQEFALVATALVVAGAARRIAGARWSVAAALVFLTAGLCFGLSRAMATDVLQLALVTPALVLLHRAALARSSTSATAALALLGVAMLAKGPIGLLVVATVWLASVLLVRGRLRLPPRGIALGLVAFAAIGLPWYAAIAARLPGVLAWFAAQLASRATGSGVGHLHGAAWLVRAWLVGLLPWTPLLLVALVRLARRPAGGRDPTDAFVVAWAIAPVVLFSLFPTKLASYVAPALPGAALAIVRAASRGLLDDRLARAALAVGFGAAVATALATGLAILGESQLGWPALPRLVVHDGPAARAFGAALVATGLAGAALARRVLASGLRERLLATAIAAGLALAFGFHAVAGDLPTLREEGRLVARVPGARLLSFTFQPSLFYYAEPAATVYVTGVEGLVEPFVDRATARRLALPRSEALAMLESDAPTFAWIDAWQADDLAALAATRTLLAARRYVLVANPAALRALAASGVTPP